MSGLWKVWLVVGCAVTTGQLLLPPGLLASSVYQVLSVSPVVALLIGVRRHRPQRAVLWYLLAIGAALWSIGDAYYTYLADIAHVEPFPSGADWFYVTAYLPLAAGLLILIRGRTAGQDRAGLIDASVIATGLALLSWVLVMRPLAGDQEVPFAERLVGLAYPAGDVLLLALVTRLLTTAGGRTSSFWFMAGSLALTTGSDISYAVVSTMGDYTAGPFDVGWLLGSVLLGTAALHPSMRSLSQTSPESEPSVSRTRLVLLVATTMLAPAVLVYEGLTDPAQVDWRAISLGAVILFLLVLARMVGLIGQVQHQAAQLRSLAHQDSLTGLPNRRAWDDELAAAMAGVRRSGDRLLVGLIDLDHFKTYNDTHGHPAGDALLASAAIAWKAQLRPDDLLARHGGEEFAVLLRGLTRAEGHALLERLLAATPEDQTFSAGLAERASDESADDLVGRADAALYQAKHQGRARVVDAAAGSDVASPRVSGTTESTATTTGVAG